MFDVKKLKLLNWRPEHRDAYQGVREVWCKMTDTYIPLPSALDNLNLLDVKMAEFGRGVLTEKDLTQVLETEWKAGFDNSKLEGSWLNKISEKG